MIKLQGRIVILLFIVCFTEVSAKENDFQFRTGFDIRKEFHKGFDLSLQYQLRYKNNVHEFQGSYFTVNPEYKINKHYSVEAEIRFATSVVWDKFRYGIGLSYKKKLDKFQLSLRGRYEFEKYRQSIPEIGQFPSKNNFRLRLQSEYKPCKRIKLFASIEPQYRVSESIGYFQRIRNIAGVEWEFIKHHTFTISYAYQPQYKTVNSFTAYILDVHYSWDIPKVKNKKKEQKENNVETGG